jgi:hypothetical protein
MLSDKQLTDVVNYLLGLPIKRNPDGGGIIRRDPVSPCVIQALSKKRKRRIGNWAELILRNEGVLPKPKGFKNCGRRTNCPPEIQRFVTYEFGPRKQPESVRGSVKAVSA